MAKISKEQIIQMAADLADDEGLEKVSLKNLAQILKIRSPSLYNHIEGLDNLKTMLMLHGWAQLGQEITMSAVGKSGDDAVRAMCKSFRDYATAHPGVFEAMLWVNQNSSKESEQATKGLARITAMVLAEYGLGEDEQIHASRMFRSFLQGFCSIANNDSFADPISINESFDFAVELLIGGLKLLKTTEV